MYMLIKKLNIKPCIYFNYLFNFESNFVFKLVFVFILSFFVIQQPTYSLSVNCSPELKPCLNVIEKLPEATMLLNQVQTEGPIRIFINNQSHVSQQFGAFWDSTNRIIFVS